MKASQPDRKNGHRMASSYLQEHADGQPGQDGSDRFSPAASRAWLVVSSNCPRVRHSLGCLHMHIRLGGQIGLPNGPAQARHSAAQRSRSRSIDLSANRSKRSRRMSAGVPRHSRRLDAPSPIPPSPRALPSFAQIRNNWSPPARRDYLSCLCLHHNRRLLAMYIQSNKLLRRAGPFCSEWMPRAVTE